MLAPVPKPENLPPSNKPNKAEFGLLHDVDVGEKAATAVAKQVTRKRTTFMAVVDLLTELGC